MKNINYVLDLVRADREDATTNNLQRYLHFALLGYQWLQLRAAPKVSVHYFTPNEVLTAALPSDYEYYTKVGILINGLWFTLTKNDRIAAPSANECGILTIEEAASCACTETTSNFGLGYFGYVPHYRAGQYVGEFYSLGGGWNSLGYFNIDYKNRQIVFRGIPQDTQLCMEYVSNGADGGATIIDMAAAFPIRQYVHYQLKEHSTANIQDKMRAKNMFEEEFTKYKQLINTPTIDEYIDVMYAGFQSGLKGVAI